MGTVSSSVTALSLKRAQKRCRASPDAKYHSAIIGRCKKPDRCVSHKSMIDADGTKKSSRVCAFRRAERVTASAGCERTKPFLKILIHAIAEHPEAGFRRLEQTEMPLLRVSPSRENLRCSLVTVGAQQPVFRHRSFNSLLLVCELQ